MIDENFQEASKRSSDGKFVCRLFRIASDDNSIHMSIEVKEDSRTLYTLPEKYWLGTEELLDWDKDQNVLFFTVNGRTKAFIYDVTFMTIVSCDLLPTENIEWNDDGKYWEIKTYYNIIKGQQKQSGILQKTLTLPYARDAEQPKYKILPTNYRHIFLILKKVEKRLAVQPVLWEIGILNAKTLTWMVEALPYLIKDESSIHFCRHNIMSCYGFSPKGFSVVIFRFDLDEIGTENRVSMYLHDNGQPQSMSWDKSCQWWRAVFNNKVIIPGRFYYDNIYSESVPVKTAPVEDEILDLLPIGKRTRQRIAEAVDESGKRMSPSADNSSQKEQNLYTLPRDQRRAMVLSSIFMFVILFALWTLLTDRRSEGLIVTTQIVSICVSISLLITGREIGHKAKNQNQYNTSCWLLWAGIWFALFALISIISFVSLMANDFSL